MPFNCTKLEGGSAAFLTTACVYSESVDTWLDAHQTMVTAFYVSQFASLVMIVAATAFLRGRRTTKLGRTTPHCYVSGPEDPCDCTQRYSLLKNRIQHNEDRIWGNYVYCFTVSCVVIYVAYVVDNTLERCRAT